MFLEHGVSGCALAEREFCGRGAKDRHGPFCLEVLEQRVLLSASPVDLMDGEQRGFSTYGETELLLGEPSRVVLQYIDNVFHRWSEFDDSDGGAMAIVLEAPERRVLSASEAEELLLRSGSWMDQQPVAASLPWEEVEELDVPPDTPFVVEPGLFAETVIGADDRVRVTDTQSFPWNTVGYVLNRYPGGSQYRGTAFLVSPHVSLTNMHMIYNAERGGFISEARLAPGQLQLTNGGSVTRPYGFHEAVAWGHNQAYIDAGAGYTTTHIQNDYAALFFDQNFSSLGISTYMPLVFNQSPSYIHLSGYPSTAHGSGTSAQWHSESSVVSVFSRYVTYTADTSGGNSGGPVWEVVNGVRRLVAIHSFGSTNHNGGPRLVTVNQSLIEGWMQWTPGPSADRFEPNETSAMATNLGIVQEVRFEPDLSIHTSTDVDWFRFELVHPGNSDSRIDLLFTHAAGNIDVQLYNSSLNVIATASSTTNNEVISLSGLPAGQYFLRVYGVAGARNVYDLRVTGPGLGVDRFEPNNTTGTATNLGRVFFPRLEPYLTIHSSSDADWFRFELVSGATSGSLVEVLFTHSSGNLNAELYNSSLSLIGSGNTTTDNEVISLSGLAAGVYYVRVFGVSGATNTYDLRIVPPDLVADRFEPNYTSGTATDLGPIATTRVESNLTIHSTSDVDWYRIELGNTGVSGNLVEILFSHQLGDLDLQLFSNPAASAIRASYSVNDNEVISLQGLAAGTYFIRVYGFSGARNLYDLRIVPPPPAPLTVTAGSFHWQTAPQRATVQFSRNVAGSLTADHFTLQNLATGSAVSSSNWVLNYDSATRTATVTFDGYANGILPNGVYRLTAHSAGLVDVFGGVMGSDYSFDFFYAAGDANRDGRVDIADLGILAANWQQPLSGPANGDFNYSGSVDIADLGILAANWQMDLNLGAFNLGSGTMAEADEVVVTAAAQEPATSRGQARRVEVAPVWQVASGPVGQAGAKRGGGPFSDGGSVLELEELKAEQVLLLEFAELAV
jgi:V8-like Glu-specific endopeptidase